MRPILRIIKNGFTKMEIENLGHGLLEVYSFE